VDHHPTGGASIEDRLRGSCYAVALPGASVDVDDNFFGLGGDSVELIRLVALAQHEFDVELRPAEFFLNPTLRMLTTLVDDQLRAASDREAELLEAILAEVDGGSVDERR
jgi:acyl carrier protein